jgi:probable addiction module antidote protein
MTIKTTAFNPMDFLQTDQEVAEYLMDAYQDEDPAVFIVALGHVVKSKGVTNVAKNAGVSRESLYKTLNGTVQPKWDTVHRLLRAMEIKLQIAA